MPGTVVVDTDLDLVADGSHPHGDDGRCVLQCVLHQIGDDLREPLGIGEPGRGIRRSVRVQREPEVGRGRAEGIDRFLDDVPGVDRLGSQRELMGVEAREVEEIGDEPFETARLGCDHPCRAELGFLVVDGAVEDRLGVATDRRERRAEVVRHAQEERPLVAPRSVELLGHRVDRLGQAAELVVGDVLRVDPRRQVARRDPPGGGLHRREWTGHAASEVGGDECSHDEREDRSTEHGPAAVAERPAVHLLGEHDHRRELVHLGERLGLEDGAAVAPLLGLARLERGDVEVVRAHAVRQRDVALADAQQAAEELAHVAVGIDRNDGPVGHAQCGLHEVTDAADLTAARSGVVGGTRGGQERDQLVELIGDDGGVLRERAARRVGGRAAREPRSDGGRHHERAERDRDHRDEEPRAETAGAARHVVEVADLDDSRR